MPRGKPETKPIQVSAGRAVDMSLADFNALKRMAGNEMQIQHAKVEFARLSKMGLVKARYDYSKGWPVALAELTTDGHMALAKEFAK